MRILRPIMPYPDLLELQLATNMSVAEKVQNGQLTVAQANEAIAQKFSEVNAEEQRRLLASRPWALRKAQPLPRGRRRDQKPAWAAQPS
jgi:hypothetical protein